MYNSVFLFYFASMEGPFVFLFVMNDCLLLQGLLIVSVMILQLSTVEKGDFYSFIVFRVFTLAELLVTTLTARSYSCPSVVTSSEWQFPCKFV